MEQLIARYFAMWVFTSDGTHLTSVRTYRAL